MEVEVASEPSSSGFASIARLLQVAVRERVGVDDQRRALRQVADVDLERRGIHRARTFVARREDVVVREVHLERTRREGARGGADLRREVRERREVVPEDRGLAREPVAGQLHAVAGVAGEADDDPLELFDVLRLGHGRGIAHAEAARTGAMRPPSRRLTKPGIDVACPESAREHAGRPPPGSPRARPARARRGARRRGTGSVPLFVFDDAILAAFGAPNRIAFLLDALAELAALRSRGSDPSCGPRGDRVEARGSPSTACDRDSSERRRERVCRGTAEVAPARGGRPASAVRTFPGVTVVPPGDLSPGADGRAYRVFTPFWNRRRTLTSVCRAGCRVPSADQRSAPVDFPPLGAHGRNARRRPTARRRAGGTLRLTRWLRDGLGVYEARRDDLAVAGTSGLVPPLRLPLAARGRRVRGGRASSEAFARQPCWRDFHHQLLASDPSSRGDQRTREDQWRDDPDALAAWKEGRTGYPVVDAGMRQLTAEGFMHSEPGWSPPRSRNTSTWTGGTGLTTSRGIWSTATSRAMSATGNGRGDGSRHAAEPRCQRSGRPGDSTPTASMCAASCPSWPHSTAPTSTSLGVSELALHVDTRHRSSSTRRP